MRLQSQNALGQAGLLIGRERLLRIDAPQDAATIKLDDWRRTNELLPNAAEDAVRVHGEGVAAAFLNAPVEVYKPVIAVE